MGKPLIKITGLSFILIILILGTARMATPVDSHTRNLNQVSESTIWIASIDQVNYKEPIELENSTIAVITLHYEIHEGSSPLYLHINAKSVLPPYEDVWFGQNIALNPFESPVELRYYSDFSSLGVLMGQKIPEVFMCMIISDMILLDPPFAPPEFYMLYAVGNVTLAISNGFNCIEWPPLQQMNPIQHNWVLANDPTWIYRGCEVPNIDLDNSANPYNNDPQTGAIYYGGDRGACALAACANSITWLETQHEEIKSGLNFREKLDCLDELIKRDFYSNSGVVIRDNIAGTLGFIDSLKLPIKVKFQAFEITDPTVDSPDSRWGHSARNEGLNLDNKGADVNRVSWDWIVNEMEAGEDVELGFGFWDGTGWSYSHGVVVTGVSKDKNVKKLTFKHDGDQGNPGGLEEVQIDITEYPNGWLSASWLTNANMGTCFIAEAVSKSYDPTVTYPPTRLSNRRSGIPRGFELQQNYPNPFNPQTRIRYNLYQSCHVILEIFNLYGQRIEMLVDRDESAGEHEMTWVPGNLSGGIYLCRLKGGTFSEVKKLIYLK